MWFVVFFLSLSFSVNTPCHHKLCENNAEKKVAIRKWRRRALRPFVGRGSRGSRPWGEAAISRGLVSVVIHHRERGSCAFYLPHSPICWSVICVDASTAARWEFTLTPHLEEVDQKTKKKQKLKAVAQWESHEHSHFVESLPSSACGDTKTSEITLRRSSALLKTSSQQLPTYRRHSGFTRLMSNSETQTHVPIDWNDQSELYIFCAGKENSAFHSDKICLIILRKWPHNYESFVWLVNMYLTMFAELKRSFVGLSNGGRERERQTLWRLRPPGTLL